MLRGRLVVDLEGYRKEQSWPVLIYNSSTCVGILREITKNRVRTKISEWRTSPMTFRIRKRSVNLLTTAFVLKSEQKT
jgi:hypothetical protein